jgi:hypothetical protein
MVDIFDVKDDITSLGELQKCRFYTRRDPGNARDALKH